MKVLLAIAATLALAACATSGAAKKSSNPRKQSLDAERMAQVEARAVGQGIDVIWVNPPTKKD